ncbi:Hypothetical predicted protein [Cloeon dipterum]|uniref:C-type lectin domain-containing protein n=1 Tax=Cloeon dipterum TaxID=197152 RepID=A0A8S1DVW1_9INSE|nr:Hypothetical predicted protein [Cloeon dipterum]
MRSFQVTSFDVPATALTRLRKFTWACNSETRGFRLSSILSAPLLEEVEIEDYQLKIGQNDDLLDRIEKRKILQNLKKFVFYDLTSQKPEPLVNSNRIELFDLKNRTIMYDEKWVMCNFGKIPENAVMTGNKDFDIFVARTCHEGELLPGYVRDGWGFFCYKGKVIKRPLTSCQVLVGRHFGFALPHRCEPEDYFPVGYDAGGKPIYMSIICANGVQLCGEVRDGLCSLAGSDTVVVTEPNKRYLIMFRNDRSSGVNNYNFKSNNYYDRKNYGRNQYDKKYYDRNYFHHIYHHEDYNSTFWTSGSNEDLNCDTSNRYAWCSTGYEVSPTLLSSSKFWLSTNASPSTLQRCMAVSIPLTSANKGGMMTWLSNWQQCCALGMEPLNIDNADEQTGLKGLTVRFKDDWKMNFNYWTSGTWQGSPQKMWSWCEPNGPTVFPPGLIWEAGQPDNRDGNETCVHFRFILNSTGAIMTDRNCTSKYVFACKSTWATAWNTCCKVGMTLASMESAGKTSCYAKIVSKYAPALNGDFWVSGMDLGCVSNFRWCSRNQDFVDSELKWKAGHPKAGLNCVYLEVRDQSVMLATASCTEKKDFLCEFALGGLKSIETLRNIELVSQEEPKKLEQGFVAYDQCSGQRTQTNPLVGEMEAINQTHEVWCRSRKVVPDNVYKSNAYRYICHQAIFLMVAASGVLDPMYYANGPGELIDAYLNRSNTYNFVQRFICEEP